MASKRPRGFRGWTGRRAAGHRRWITWLVAASVFFQAFLPIVHRPMAMSGTLPGELVLLCTSTGFRLVRLADLGGEAQAAGKARPAGSICPICLGAASLGTGLAPDAFALPAPAAIAVAAIAPADLSVDRTRPHAPHSPRAPPRLS